MNVVPFVEPDVAAHLGLEAIGAATTGIIKTHRVLRRAGVPLSETDFGEGRSGWTLDTPATLQLLPALGIYAERLVSHLLTHGVHARWDESHPRSRMTLKVYAPGDRQGLHVDTNGLTAVLMLHGATAPDFPDRRDDPPEDAPVGSLLVFDGSTPHRVRPTNVWRVTVVFNLYGPDDVPDRPVWADEMIYG